MKIDIIVYDGVEELDVFGPYEVFRVGALAGAELDCSLVTPFPKELLRAAHGVRFVPDAELWAGADVLVVPGGGWVTRRSIGAWAEAERGDWLSALARARDEGVGLIAGVCTGTMLLARAGIIRDRRATTHHAAKDELRALGAEVVDGRVVDDGDLVTCGGVTSGIDLALWILEREFSAALAESVAEEIEYRYERPASA